MSTLATSVTPQVPRSAQFTSMIDVLRYWTRERGSQIVYTFLADGTSENTTLTFSELDRRARAIAVALRSQASAGDRVLLLFPPDLEFVTAFFGTLYAGMVAVPAYPPQIKRLERDLPRLQAILVDSGATVALTTRSTGTRLEQTDAFLPEFLDVKIIKIEDISPEASQAWEHPGGDEDTLTFLQYTSGSTGLPKGVMVPRGALLQNQRMISQAFAHSSGITVVSWLPLYHDMGLIGTTLQPLFMGGRAIIMPPAAFLQRPARWLRAISHYQGNSCGGPNFAYDWCVQKVTPEQCDGLDLSSWSIAFNGSEPVRPATMDAFARKFAPYGFNPKAFFPCYGLAEITLLATSNARLDGPTVKYVDEGELAQGRVSLTKARQGARALASSGHAWLDRKVAIVNPEAGTRCPPDHVGEIWLSGGDVARGYWNRPEESELTFRAYITDTGEGPFLRTGDLGFLHADQLYVTGRLKDLIILEGRNHYPQDIELTVEHCHPALRTAASAAFSVDVEGQEVPVVVAELDREFSTKVRTSNPEAFSEGVASAVRMAVIQEHGIRLHELVLLRVGSIPRTTSGKVRRRDCRAGYLEGTLPGVLYRRGHRSELAPGAHAEPREE